MTTKFIVAGIQRSGTGLLNHSLNLHPDIQCFGEVFLIKKGQGKDTKNSLRQYLDSLDKLKKCQYFFYKNKLVLNYLENFYCKTQSPATGFNLMYDQFCRFPAIKEYIIENNVKIVNLVRKNLLKVLVSRYVMSNTGIPHSKIKIEIGKVNVPIHSLIYRLERLSKESTWAESIVEKDKYLKIYYEEIQQNLNNSLIEAYDFLGVPKIETIKPKLKKTSPDKLDLVIENYDEVVKKLKGTKFECFLQ